MSTGYHTYTHSNQYEARIKQLEDDKNDLSLAIDDLNMCYQHKIRLLQSTIAQQQQRYDELLEWKKQHINKSLFEVEKYENEIKKMIQILDNAHRNFEHQKQSLIQELQQQSEFVKQLTQQNQQLTQFNSQNQSNIQKMVRMYTEQIDKLRQELRQLRDESVISQEYALRETTLKQNLDRNSYEDKTISEMGGSFAAERDPVLSKISIQTIGE